MGTAGFRSALDRGEPLADVTVVFRPGVNDVLATAYIDSLADDFDLWPRPWYGDPRLRADTATRAAPHRLFGWTLRRAMIPGRSPGPNDWWWREDTQPARWPSGLEKANESVGLSQPGADDDGQWFDYE